VLSGPHQRRITGGVQRRLTQGKSFSEGLNVGGVGGGENRSEGNLSKKPVVTSAQGGKRRTKRGKHI